jgi:hypothetical protein
MRLAGHVARTKTRGMQLGFWKESQKKDIRGWIILKWILEK